MIEALDRIAAAIEAQRADYVWQVAPLGLQLLLIIVLIATAFLGYRQLRAQVRHAQISARQAHATLLLDLDRRWESAELADARKIVREERRRVTELADEQSSTTGSTDLKAMQADIFCSRLAELRRFHSERYEGFMRIWGFFETIGHLTQNGYLKAEKVHSIFGTVVVQAADISEMHIHAREKAEADPNGSAPRLYENFLWLASELRRLATS